MKINHPKYLPLVSIPQDAELAIFLLKQDLKSKTLASNLEHMGFDGSVCISDFSSLIFSTMGFDQRSDAFYEWYLGQLAIFCKDVDLSDASTLSKQAFEFYIHLVMEKKKQE